MRFTARTFAILALLFAAATPAAADVAYDYCVVTVTANPPVTGPRSQQLACGSAGFVHCESLGTVDTPPTLLVRVCVGL